VRFEGNAIEVVGTLYGSSSCVTNRTCRVFTFSSASISMAAQDARRRIQAEILAVDVVIQQEKASEQRRGFTRVYVA